MAESRECPRMRVLKGVKIVLGASSVLDCVVRDLTNSGARVKLQNTANLPEDVAITFDGGRTCRQCRVVWRTLSEIGVQFTDPALLRTP